MKHKTLLLTIAIFCACTGGNKHLSNVEKEKITGEAKVLITTIVQACEKVDPEKLKSTYLNSPDFVSLVGGVYADYNQTLQGMYGFMSSVSGQKALLLSEKYTVLDKTTVLYTAKTRWESKMKNDSTIITDPCGLQFILKKVNNEWKVLSWTECLK